VLLASWAVLALGSGGAAWAQTTGTLQGTVFDEDSLEVAGVTVTISSSNLIGGSQTTTTDSNGFYRFVQLLPGLYNIKAVHPEFRTTTIEGVQVLINHVATQNVTLKLGSSEEVVVEAKAPVIDTESTTIGNVLTKDFLQKIPTGRSYQDAVKLTAGTTGGANPNMAGGASNENSYMIDGAVVTDPVTGTFANNFNFDAIQQIEVLLGGYDAEYGISLGGIVNLVTDSGTNNLEFDTSVYYSNGNWRGKMDERLTADGYQLATTQFDSTLQVMTISARVSGPLVQDKAWFIFSYQYTRSLIALAGIPQRRDFDGHYVLGKLTVQPSSAHRITLLVQADPTTIDNLDQSSQFIKAEAQPRQAQSGFTGQLRWQWFINEDMNLDTRVQIQKSSIEANGVPCTHDRTRDVKHCDPGLDEGTVDWETPGHTGTFGAYDSVNYGRYYFDDRWRFAAGTKYSLLGLTDKANGRHDLKIGVETNQYLNDMVQGISGNLMYIDLNVNGYDPATFSNYYWLESSGPVLQRNTGSTWSAFIQDAYKPIPRLTIRAGLRYDNTLLRNEFGDPVVRGSMFAPRLFASWDPFGDQKMKVAGGYGRFNEQGRQALAGFTSQNAFGSKLYLGEYFHSFDAGLGYTNAAAQMYDMSSSRNLATVAPVLTLPSVDEVDFMVQRQVVPDVALGATFQGRWTRSLYTPDEQNLIWDEDGSQIIGSRRGDYLNSYPRLRTPRWAQRNYYSVRIDLEKRTSRRWGGKVTYNFTWIQGSTNNSESTEFMRDPQTQYVYGRLLTARMHQVVGYGYWDIPNDPWTTTLGFTVNYESGLPLERFYWDDNSGGYGIRIRDRSAYWQFNDVWSIGARIQQAFDVRKGKLLLDLSLQNLLNNRAPQDYDSNFYQLNRIFAVSRQSPFTMQVGLRYQF
jgi:outer membrane receptor protein involved in Fe transport